MIDVLELGATLYMPATRTDLAAALSGGHIPGLRSAVVCLEDAVRAEHVPAALASLAALLARPGLDGGAPLVFVRPRDPTMLARILRMPGVERVAGFVLPKVTAETLPEWLAHPFAPSHLLMPTLETREMFDPVEARRLRDQLLVVQERVLAVRIGGNDLLQCLGVRRAPGRTSYDGPLGPLIAMLAGVFLPFGIPLSAPVMEGYGEPVLLRDEFQRDMEHGLFTKTVIHPAQIAVVQGALTVPARDLAEAEAILGCAAPAVFAANRRMCEPATHRRWAETIVRRAALFGAAEPIGLAASGSRQFG
ncbi:HpcH/HpaI aldolase/citrate lyase family protein [Sphingomonas sp.]|jgi:citrate lyase beta subunit|uniref:HpcH/HpaI aldolase/citrate lyase family protein n=1 Tax=Sphingomonas sp. TaxID=28214 RepID=UPI002DE8AC95|nr:HpcH/HpaI aldolase/citrate lyase family protein [Sphingomonas sp.]